MEHGQIPPDEAQSYLAISRLRERAEAAHGRRTIERVTEVYRRNCAELQAVPHPPFDRRSKLLRECARLEHAYGYEVLAGVPRVTRGSHPRHDWSL
jgi:hypothetical protein